MLRSEEQGPNLRNYPALPLLVFVSYQLLLEMILNHRFPVFISFAAL